MTGDGHAVALLSGELTVEQRAQVIDRFREGKEKVLITTNVSARGKPQPRGLYLDRGTFSSNNSLLSPMCTLL